MAEQLKLFDKRRALVVLSGGQDSTTCLYWAKAQFDEVYAIVFDYGQRHSAEIQAASRIAWLADVIRLERVRLGAGILHSTSPLVSDSALEQYTDHASLPGGIEKTFVPMRNQLFLTIAANRAIELGCTTIITGVCQEDYGGYPDCRREFINSLEVASNKGAFGNEQAPLTIATPLMYMTKADAVRMAFSLPGCYGALAYSHTAYDGAYPPTGKDHASLLRAKGFEQAGIPDPLVLRAVYIDGCMPCPAGDLYDKAHPLFNECMERVLEVSRAFRK